MLAKFARRVSRRLSRRVVYMVLGVTLVAGMVGTAWTRSWAVLLALTSLVVMLAVTVLDVRRNRIMLGNVHQQLWGVDRRVRSLSSQPELVDPLARRIDELEKALRLAKVQAAVAQHDQAKGAADPPGERVPRDLVPEVVLALIDRGDALDAHALATSTRSLRVLTTGTLRKLRNELWQRGYLPRALEVARVAERVVGEDRDRHVRRRIAGEIAVLSGNFTPTLPPEAPGFKSRPKRVLHLVGRSLPDDQVGYSLRTHYTAIAQRHTGLDPHVATQMGVSHAGDDYISEILDDITYHRIPGPSRADVPFDIWWRMHVRRVANLVRVVRPAILHAASDFINAIAAEAVGKSFGIPVIYESRGFWEESWLSRNARKYGWNLDRLKDAYGLPDAYLWRQEIEHKARQAADRVVTLADVMADRIEAGGVRRDLITVVPNAVSVDEFPVLGRDDELAASLGIGNQATVIGYISSLVEYEGIDTLIAAYAKVKESSPVPVTLLIVGDGPVHDQLVRQADALGLDDAVFTGRVPHDSVQRYYSLIDIFVVPRRPVEVSHLVTPLKPFEAFSTGRTVVLSNVRALADIAAESGAAELFEAGDAQSLANLLLALLKNPDRRSELAASGAKWVRAERTWDVNAQAYLRVYEETGAISPATLYPHLPAPMSIAELRRSVPEHKSIPVETGAWPRQPDLGGQDVDESPQFRSRPFVCGAIGRWDPVTMDRVRTAIPTALRNVHTSDVAVVWASSEVHEWKFHTYRGLYWSPQAQGPTPNSWRSAAEGRLAAGVVLDGDTALLHTCALGFQELYLRELGSALYFAVRIDPLLAVDAGGFHPDLEAWASVLALGCPLGDATPFLEVRRAVAATAWRAKRGQHGGPTRLSFEPAWLGSDPARPPGVDEVVDRIAAQIPGPDSQLSVMLSGGRDSRLLAALASMKRKNAPTAWTSSTDDGLERDLALAGPVAEALSLEHRVLVPGPEAWLEDRHEVRARLQYQTWYHTWMMPLARTLHGRNAAVLDGLAGDALLDGGAFINEGVRQQVGSGARRSALLARLTSNRLGDKTLVTPTAAAWIEQSVRSAFMTATDHFENHPEMLTLSLLSTRTIRAIAASPTWLVGPEAEVLTPIVHPEVLGLALRVPFEKRVGGEFYRQLLDAACGRTIASLPTTKDLHGAASQNVAQRQRSPAALEAMGEVIMGDEQVRTLLSPQLRRALSEPDLGARMTHSYNVRVTLQWAELLASWKSRYGDRLLWPERGVGG